MDEQSRRMLLSIGAVESGTAWTIRTSGTNESLLAVTWNGTVFCVVGLGGTIRTSTDGITWTARTSGTVNSLWGVAWNGTVFCVVGFSGTVLTSPD